MVARLPYILYIIFMEELSSAEALIVELKRYIDLRLRHIKFLGTEKLSYLIAAVAFMIIATIFGIIAICYFSLSLVHLLRIYVGTAGAYAIMGAVAILIVALLYLKRKQWLLNPITRILARSILDEGDETE